MLEEPRTNIEVRMVIPSQTYMAAAQEIMAGYSDVVVDALNRTKASLMFDKDFHEEVKETIKKNLYNAVKQAIISAAQSAIWKVYRENDLDIERMIEKAILSTIKKEPKTSSE